MPSFFLPTVAAIAAILFAGLLFKPTYPGPLAPVAPGDAIVITGTSTGIGKHVSLSLAKQGYTVFAGVRKQQDGEALRQSALHHGVDVDKIKILILDVTNSEHIQRAVETVSRHPGKMAGLFNNAGIGGELATGVISTAAEFTPMEEYRKVFDVNFFGLVAVTRAFLPLLRRDGGRIVMNSSIAGFIGGPFLASYVASKHAVEGFADGLRRELLLARTGVRVAILECALVATPILAGTIPAGREPYARAERRTARQFWKDALTAAPPRVASAAVAHALRAARPRVRYVVGKDAAIIRWLRYLPGHWLDFLLLNDFTRKEIKDSELEALLHQARSEFEL